VAAAYSAFGMFAMDVGRNYARSYICGAKNIDVEKVNRLYREMEAEALAGFRANDISPEQVVFRRSAEMRYGGQFHEVEVELMGSLRLRSGQARSAQGGAAFSAEQLEATVNEFHRQHDKLYTFRMPWKAAEFLTFRLRATAPRAPFHLRRIDAGGPDGAGAIKRLRRCWFDGQEVDTPVYDGTRLLAGARFAGPAIIEETTTTVVIPARFDCAVDQWKNYLLTRVEKGSDPFDKLRVMVREIEP